MSPEDQAKTLFTVESTGSFIDDPHNDRFRVCEQLSFAQHEFVSRSSTPSTDDPTTPTPPETRTRTYLRFTVDNIGDQTSFVFGSQRESCDIHVEGTDHRLFAVELKNHGREAMLKNLSRRRLAIHSPIYDWIQFSRSRVLHPDDRTTILLEKFDIAIHFHSHRGHKDLHEYYLQQLRPRLEQAVPIIKQLNLQSMPESSRLSQTMGNPYYKSCEVGHGAFGTVYRGVHVVTGEVVAIKTFRKSKPSPLKEAAILQALSHPNIVRFIDFVAPGSGSFMLVMEFINHLNIEDAHQRRAFLMIETRSVLQQVLQGLAYLHSARVTHRDIKPSNILLVSYEPMHIKLTDFGLAIGRSDQLSTHCGSLAYVAPEVHEGSYNDKVDIWSVGVVALWLTVGLPDYPRSRGKNRDWPSLLKQRLDTSSADRLFYHFTKCLLRSRADNRPSAEQSLEDQFFQLDWYVQTQSALNSPEIRSQSGDTAWQTAPEIFAPLPLDPLSLQQTVHVAGSSPTEVAPTRTSTEYRAEDRHRSVNAPSPSTFAARQTQLFAAPLQDNALAEWQPQASAQEVQEQAQAAQALPSSPLSVLRVPARAAKPARAAATYWKLKYAGNRVITYKPNDALINATQLIKAHGYTKTIRWGAIEKKVGKFHQRISKNGEGTYVSMTDAQKIFQHLRLRADALEELTRQINEYKK